MNLDFRTIPRPDLNLELITLNEISRFVGETSPFRNKFSREDDVVGYLSDVNGYLVERKLDPRIIFNKYMNAACIYVFLDEIFNYQSVKNVQAEFKKILAKSPYNINNPLDLFFRDARSNADQEFNDEDLAKIPDYKEKDHEKFKRSDHFIHKLNHELKIVSGLLRREYSKGLHFEFIGYYDIGLPMFDNSIRKTADLEIQKDKLGSFGEFLIKVPTYFDDEAKKELEYTE